MVNLSQVACLHLTGNLRVWENGLLWWEDNVSLGCYLLFLFSQIGSLPISHGDCLQSINFLIAIVLVIIWIIVVIVVLVRIAILVRVIVIRIGIWCIFWSIIVRKPQDVLIVQNGYSLEVFRSLSIILTKMHTLEWTHRVSEGLGKWLGFHSCVEGNCHRLDCFEAIKIVGYKFIDLS